MRSKFVLGANNTLAVGNMPHILTWSSVKETSTRINIWRPISWSNGEKNAIIYPKEPKIASDE